MSAWLTVNANALATSSAPEKLRVTVDSLEGEELGGVAETPQQIGKIPQSALLHALNQLAVMVSNGIDLAEAVMLTGKYCKHENLARLLRRCHAAVTQGSKMSAALAQEPAFPRWLTAMLAAAEASGSMAAALRRGTALIRSEIQLRGTIVSAMIYPAILVGASLIVINALVFFVLPQFGKVFSSMGKPVPASTAALLAVGAFARQYWYWFAGGFPVSAIAAYFVWRHPASRRGFDAILVYAPIVRDAYRPLATGRMLTNLGGMLSGGINLLDAVRLTRNGMSNRYFQKLLGDLEVELLAGGTTGHVLATADFLPPEAVQMAMAAERTGRMAEVFTDLGAYYEEEGGKQLKRLVHLIEPMVILVMGVLVAGVVLSIMLPLLDISSAH